MPPARPVNEPEPSQVVPPSIEYCSGEPFGDDAVIMIVPSEIPQSVGSVNIVDAITGSTLSVNVMTGPVT